MQLQVASFDFPFAHMCVCVCVSCRCVVVCVHACVHNLGPLGREFLNDDRVELFEAHDDIQRDGGAQLISVQTQVPDAAE